MKNFKPLSKKKYIKGLWDLSWKSDESDLHFVQGWQLIMSKTKTTDRVH